MFAHKMFIKIQRKPERACNQKIWNRVAGDLETPGAGEVFGEIAQVR